jgi:hypothetical protein
VIKNLHDGTDYHYVKGEMFPVWLVARLIRSVWEYGDRKRMELIAEANSAPAL